MLESRTLAPSILVRIQFPSQRSSRYRLVFSVSAVAGIIPILPRVSVPVNATAPTRDAIRLFAFPISRSHALVLPLNGRKFGNSVSQFSDATLEIGRGGRAPPSRRRSRRPTYSRRPPTEHPAD